MSIETIGNMRSLLKSYNAEEWTKSSDLKVKDLNIDEFKDYPNKVPTQKNSSFTEMLASSILEVNDLQKEANTAIEKLATGKSKNLHETMLAVEKADIAFRSMNQVRQKVIEAYKEIMRMQV